MTDHVGLTSFPNELPSSKEARSTPVVWGGVPPRNPNFTGRAELLEQLHERLTPGGATAILPTALHGLGGVGKTQLAIEYIYLHQDAYDLVWWVNAARPEQIAASLSALGRLLGISESSDPQIFARLVRDALKAGDPVQRWLLVFDDVKVVPDAVRRYFPVPGPGRVLVTSRRPDRRYWKGIADPVAVPRFSRCESLEFIQRHHALDEDQATRLAAAVRDMPGGLEVVCGLLEDRRLQLATRSPIQWGMATEVKPPAPAQVTVGSTDPQSSDNGGLTVSANAAATDLVLKLVGLAVAALYGVLVAAVAIANEFSPDTWKATSVMVGGPVGVWGAVRLWQKIVNRRQPRVNDPGGQSTPRQIDDI